MMRFHHDIIIFVKNIITGEDYQNLSQNALARTSRKNIPYRIDENDHGINTKVT